MKRKRLICALLCAAVAAGAGVYSPSVEAATHPNLLIGDANRDGKISIRDVTAIQRHLAEMAVFDSQTAQIAKTDFSNDSLGINDATIIQKRLAEYDEPEAREVGHAAFVWKSSGYVPAITEYQSYLDKNLSSVSFNGVACVTRNGRVLCQAAVGKANAAENREMTPDTLFPVGSVSKQFCAAVILRLQEQGLLSVGDKLQAYFPAYDAGKNITLHQLLSMRSGIRDYVNSDSTYTDHEYPMSEYTLSPDNTDEENQQIILDWLFGESLKFTPGRSFAYSNSNYLLLSLIAEKVTGKRYGDLLREMIFTPLEMTASGVYDEMQNDPDIAEDLSALPENIDPDELFTVTWALSHPKGDGDIVTNAADMNKWLDSLSDGTILSRESLTAMTTVYSAAEQYGYGICVTSDGSLHHGGDIGSYESSARTNPADHLNIFIVTNNVETVWAKNIQVETLSERMAKKIK